MLAQGTNGSVEFRGNHITIKRKGLANVLTQGIQGDKTIPLSSITAVQFRPAGSMIAGLIQFSIVGGREFRGGMLEATKDENAVMFDRSQEAAFVALRDVVQSVISAQATPPAQAMAGSSRADELLKLASLLEKGHLSRDEFETVKRELLVAGAALDGVQAEPLLEPMSGRSERSEADARGECVAGRAAGRRAHGRDRGQHVDVICSDVPAGRRRRRGRIHPRPPRAGEDPRC